MTLAHRNGKQPGVVKTKVEDLARGEAAGVGLTGGTETDLNKCDLIFEAVSTYCVYVTVYVTENNERVYPVMEEELPDIPYQPVREASYDEAGTSTSSTGNKHNYGTTYIPDYLQVPLTRNDHEL